MRARGEHNSVTKLIRMWLKHGELGEDLVGIRGKHMVTHMTAELAEPPRRDLRQNCAFGWNRFAHHDVERAYAVGCYKENALVVDGINVAHLATSEESERKLSR